MRRRAGPLGGVAIGVAVFLGTVACSGSDAGDAVTPRSTASVATRSTPSGVPRASTSAMSSTSMSSAAGTSTTSVSAGGSSSTTAAATGAPDAANPMPEGASFGYVTGVGIAAHTISIDVARLLTGDAAVAAAVEDGAAESGATSVDNDYYIRNKNPLVRTVAVSPTAAVQVLADPGSADLRPASLTALAADLSAAPDVRLPVQVLVVGGVITRVDEAFFP